ncbi:MAG: hypothetical protein SFU25_09880, partial [Candidatus Caenarcaniphilales bacterium]|nr:hypothetical protein [Candidatus Caenarcaniphilales bacterium]
NLFSFETPWNLTDNPLPTSKENNWAKHAEKFFRKISNSRFYAENNRRTAGNLGYIFGNLDSIEILPRRLFPYDQREQAISEMFAHIFSQVSFKSLTSELIFQSDQPQGNHLKMSLMHVRRLPESLEIMSASSRFKDQLSITMPQTLEQEQFRSLQLTTAPNGLTYRSSIRTHEYSDSHEGGNSRSVVDSLSQPRFHQYLNDVILGSGISVGDINFNSSLSHIEEIKPEFDYSFFDKPRFAHCDERFALFEVLKAGMKEKSCPQNFLAVSQMESNLQYWNFILKDFLKTLYAR